VAPVVSVVIPVSAAHAQTVRWQLRCLEVQVDAPSFEIVLADSSGRLAGGDFTGCDVVDAASAIGAGGVRNVGAARARARLLLFCDADDLVSPRWVAEHVLALETARFTGGPVARLSNRPALDEAARAAASGSSGKTRLARHEGLAIVDSANMGIHADVFWSAGGFDLRYLRAQDVALSLKLHQAGIKPSLTPGALVWGTDERRPAEQRRISFLRGVAEVRLRREFSLSGSLLRDLGRPLKGVSASQRRNGGGNRAAVDPQAGRRAKPQSYTLSFALGALAESTFPERGHALRGRPRRRVEG
jgi:hypothetical protein